MSNVRANAESAPVAFPTTRTCRFQPAPELGELRDQQPLCPMRYPDGHVGWLVTSYALARAVLVSSQFSVRTPRQAVGDPGTLAEFFAATWDMPEKAGVILELDPPQHTRIRRALAGYFTVKRVAEYEGAIAQIVSDRLDAMEQAGSDGEGQPVDLYATFALPMSSLVVCELLGAPPADRVHFEAPSFLLNDTATSGADRIVALNGFFAYCRRLIERKRADPGDDLLSDLIRHGELTEDELVGIALILFEAAHETTSTQLTLSILALLEQRERWDALLVAGREERDNAIEELLRYMTIVQLGAVPRTAVEDVELDGVLIKEGESVMVSLAAPNRDPERFPDPDELDLSRDASGHVAFGHGRHMCIGQHLARLELRLGLDALMERFPTLRLATPLEEIEFTDGENQLYAVHGLLVTW